MQPSGPRIVSRPSRRVAAAAINAGATYTPAACERWELWFAGVVPRVAIGEVSVQSEKIAPLAAHVVVGHDLHPGGVGQYI
jgi:hypothetical protein